jgi:streptogramin lyase
MTTTFLLVFFKIGNKNMFLTNNSLFVLANDSPKIIRNLHFPKGHLINMDTNGDVWAIKKDSLFKVHLEQIEDIFHPSNYMSNLTKNARVTRILIDKQGNYWLGTNGFGVLKISAPQKQKASFLKNISAWQVYLDSKGNVYSWEFNMLFKSDLSGNKIKKIGSGDAQGSLIEAKNGNFWKLIRNQSKSPNIFLQHLNSDLQLIKAYDLGRGFGVPYLRILEDHNGKLIIADFPKEIVRFDPEKERISYFDFSKEFLMGSRGVLHIYEDRANTIWISGESGLLKIKSKADAYTFKAFSESSNSKKPFPSNYITCSVDYSADPDNYLLIGTHSSGLLKRNKKTGEFQQYTIKDGLPSNNIAGIIPETKNRVWLSSYFGIVVYDFESKLSMVYNRKDGLSSDEYNMGSFFKGKNGELVFGGINGVSIINPKMISQMKREINLKLVGFSVNNKNILPFDETGLIKESIEYLPFITLAHNENNISLKFVDLNNGAKKLKYRLLGTTEKWTEVNPNSEVNYTLLPPGKYKFELANSSIDFGEEREVLSFDFEIRSPWYWNWISIMTYLLIAGWIIYMLLKNQSKQIRLNQELIFNAKEKDRLVELEELKSNFFTNVSHELKTPLTLIEGPINDLNKKYPDESLFKLIKPNIKRLRQLMYQILDVQKLEAGKVN